MRIQFEIKESLANILDQLTHSDFWATEIKEDESGKKIIKIKLPVYQAYSYFNSLLKTSRNIFLVLLWGIVGNCVILQPE